MWEFMNCFKWIQCKPGEMLFLFLFTGTKIVSIFLDVVTCRFVLWRPLFKERMTTYSFVLGGSITSGCTLMTGVVWVLLVDNYFMINQCFCTNFGFPRTQHWSWDFPLKFFFFWPFFFCPSYLLFFAFFFSVPFSSWKIYVQWKYCLYNSSKSKLFNQFTHTRIRWPTGDCPTR